MSPATATIQLFDVESSIAGETVAMSVLLPPGFDPAGSSLPLLIYLHGGGGDRTHLVESAPLYGRMFDEGLPPPMVVVSFSSGPGSFYYGLNHFATPLAAANREWGLYEIKKAPPERGCERGQTRN